MAVYVDDIRHYPKTRLRHKYWCHMNADTTEELEAMARRVGLNPSWIQKPGTSHEHYDLTPSMRAKALQHGAVAITFRELGAILKAKRERRC